MKSKVIFLLLIISMFVMIGVVYYVMLSFKARQGNLKILSIPDAMVYLDNKKSGSTPFESQLAVGEYLVNLVPQNQSTQAATWKGKVKININTVTFIHRELGNSDITSTGIILSMENIKTKNNTGVIEVNSEPMSSIVAIDNIEHGITPITIVNIEPGDHELSVYNPGFIKRSQKVKVKANYQLSAQFKLAVDTQYQPVNLDVPIQNSSPSATPQLNQEMIIVKETETGFLNVRDNPSISASLSAQVKPGERFDLVEKNNNGWYLIRIAPDKTGWVASRYCQIVTPTPPQ